MPESEYIDSVVIERLRSVLLSSRFPVSGAFLGIHHSLLKGSAMEFAELRDYAPGDDLRRLDWKAYGRSDKYFLKEYESEINARVYFVLDTSGSMNFQTASGSRLTYAKKVVATLASLFLYQGDAVGVLSVNEMGLAAPLLRGESSLPKVLEALDRIRANGVAPLDERLHLLADLIPRRSLVVVLSDFFTPLDALEPALQHLRHCSHEVTFLQHLSEVEETFSGLEATAFRDLETGEVVKTVPETVRANYIAKFTEHESLLKRISERNRVALTKFMLEDSVEVSLRAFLKRYLDF